MRDATDHMADELELELEPLAPPGPRTTRRRTRGRRARLGLSIAAGLAGAAGFAGTALLSDSRQAEGEQETATNGARPIPIVAPIVGDDDEQRSGAAGAYAVATWSAATQSGVLGGWGAVTPAVVAESGVAEVAAIGGQGIPIDDPRLADPATPAFVDPCTAGPATERRCPDSDLLAHVVLGGTRPPPNSVTIHPFPSGAQTAGSACDFAGAEVDELPVLVVTANPGRVTVVAGSDEASAESSDVEREEWEAWIRQPVGTRPPVSFVAHCVLLDRPSSPGPVVLTATATDDDDQEVTARVTLGELLDGLPPVVAAPVDGTMLRVEVPLPAGDALASVVATPLRSLGGVADCSRVTPELAAASMNGWRRGAVAVSASTADRSRPWLVAAPRLQRVTVPLAEGEPNLVCISTGAGPELRQLALVASPPDARRLVLAITELRLVGAPPGGGLRVTATFPAFGWTPCAARVPASGAGSSQPGDAGVLCRSGGDTGAIAAAGSVVDVAIRAGDQAATHTARIALVAVPGGPDTESYRLPIPAADFSGILCTPGVDQPSCIEPDADSSLGTVLIQARWADGPVGEDRWRVTGPGG